MAKLKVYAISVTATDRAISSTFLTPRVFKKYTMPTFQKVFKNGGHFEFFQFLSKMAKLKIYAISLTVTDRAISSKLLMRQGI